MLPAQLYSRHALPVQRSSDMPGRGILEGLSGYSEASSSYYTGRTDEREMNCYRSCSLKRFSQMPFGNWMRRQVSAALTSRSRQPAKEMLSCSTARCSAVRPDFRSWALTSAPAAISNSRHGKLLLIMATWMAFRPTAQAQGWLWGRKALGGQHVPTPVCTGAVSQLPYM